MAAFWLHSYSHLQSVSQSLKFLWGVSCVLYCTCVLIQWLRSAGHPPYRCCALYVRGCLCVGTLQYIEWLHVFLCSPDPVWLDPSIRRTAVGLSLWRCCGGGLYYDGAQTWMQNWQLLNFFYKDLHKERFGEELSEDYTIRCSLLCIEISSLPDIQHTTTAKNWPKMTLLITNNNNYNNVMVMFPLCSFSLVVSISKTAKNTGKEILIWCTFAYLNPCI